jgi:hypothetical protein
VVRRWTLITVLVALATSACSVPSVALPPADPVRVPSTLPRTTTTSSSTTTTVAPPVTTPPPAQPTAPPPTIEAPPLPANDLQAAADAIAAARGTGVRYLRIEVNPGGAAFYVEQQGRAIPYLWIDGQLLGPGDPVTFGDGGVAFTAASARLGGVPGHVQRTESFAPGARVRNIVAVGAPNVGVLWVLSGARASGSPVSAVWGADGTLRGLQA